MKARMSLADKHNLYAEHLKKPNATYTELAVWAMDAFKLISPPTKSTVGNAITRHDTKSQRSDLKSRSMDRGVAMPDLEAKVLSWVLRCEELGVCVTGELIRKQAKAYYDEYELVTNWPLKFSKGWLYKFQRKHSLTSKRQHGEAGSTPQEAVDQGREQMLEATTGYEVSDVYNMDETSSFWCMSPHRSITRSRVPGTKKSKKRITLALTTNADGSDLVEPLFIGSAVRPRCFNGQTAEDLGFAYTSSKKAWMNGAIFDTYMRSFNARMEAANRRVLLLVDNASPHKVKEDTVLTNVSLKMLPSNTTAYLQPQDAGIIASFKAKVKQRQLQNALEQIDAVMAGRQDKLYEVPLVDAMAWAKDAWHEVSQSTIVNCWSRTGILRREAGLQNPRIVGHE
ncbi:hypothetical protein DYB36_008668 [Aphanomyces astaci]|uniref:HTH CENPB-type domain-containing protein n=1 Tax=Aphanomyces astaci TaxID=112090 RepID=A0A397AK29_APHAT|nr:hypothetical protein DYB36_008668 [Aphanomyces astaci]